MKDGLFFLLFAFLPGVGYQTIQDRWRPSLADASETVVYFLGIAPNLLGAVSLTAGLFVIARHMIPTLPLARLALYTAVVALVGLLGWEVLQIWLPNGTFDVNDLLWTVPGVAVAWVATRLWYAAEWQAVG